MAKADAALVAKLAAKRRERAARPLPANRRKGGVVAFLRESFGAGPSDRSVAEENALIAAFAAKYAKAATGARRHTKRRDKPSAYAAFVKGEVAK